MSENPYAPPKSTVDGLVRDSDAFEYAGFWIRFVASLIDTVVMLIVTYPILIAVYGWAYLGTRATLIAGPVDFLVSWVLPLAATVFLWLRFQATPGKMVLSLHVVDARTGKSLKIWQALIRYLGYVVSTLPLCLGFIWVAPDPRKQGWHDKMAGSVVIRPKHRGPEAVKFEQRK